MELFKVSVQRKIYWMFYSKTGEYQQELSVYLIHCVDDLELKGSTVSSRAYALKNWACFAASNQSKLLDANDNLIKKYRDYLLETKNKNSSGDIKSRQRSINQYLRMIYDFYHWVQVKNYSSFILGSSDIYNIYSELGVDRRNQSEFEKYPLLFRRTSSKSKHRTTYTPDYDTFLALYRYFISYHSGSAAERNCLILKIAFEAGLRVGSIASLVIEDFDLSKIKANEDHFTITPSVQKFGMNNSFDISINLAMTVVEYINGPRNQICKKTESRSNHVFLNIISGSHLLSTSISSLFSKASKKLGLPYRSGIHSWRGLFTENLIDYEYDVRQELGFDTSIESIGMVVSKALGHSSPLSQQSYIRSLKSKPSVSQAFKHMQEVQSLREQLLHSSKECELLRMEVITLSTKI